MKRTKPALTLRLLQSTGCYTVFDGSKNLGGTNTNDLKKAVDLAGRRFPGRSLRVKDFFRA